MKLIKISKALSFLLILCIINGGCGKNILSKLKQKGQYTLSRMISPLSRSIVNSLLENCDSMKDVLGVSYEKLKYVEPKHDYNVTMVMWEGQEQKDFNINFENDRKKVSKKIDLKKPLYIFVHGFLSSSSSEPAQEVTDALRAKGSSNVLALDCSDFLKRYYVRSTTCIRFIGEQLGSLLIELNKCGVNPKNIHMMGHSLGSHIAGFAGKTFKNITGKTVGRISALDPAGPCFFKKQQDLRLSKNDANFVDAIHTNAGVLGFPEPLGHVDFYPNGGKVQPGCVISPCSHSRAWEYFAESIEHPTNFVAAKCHSWNDFKSDNCTDGSSAYMGMDVDKKTRGTYYFKTATKSPFGMGKTGAICELRSKFKRFLG